MTNYTSLERSCALLLESAKKFANFQKLNHFTTKQEDLIEMVKGFSKMYNSSFFGHIFFANIFYYITGFCDKKFNFCKANVFADSKSRAQDLSNDVSFVKFGHQTWDLKGGGN